MSRLVVRVTPKATIDEVAGWRGAELLVRVAAAPEAGRANAAVERVVARALGVPKGAVNVVRGHTARVKHLEIDGIGDGAIVSAFGQPPETLF